AAGGPMKNDVAASDSGPALPHLGDEPHGGAIAGAHDGGAQEQRIIDQDLLDARAGGSGVLEAALEVALALPIDERLRPAHGGGDLAQLPRRGSLLRQIDELVGEAALLEPALGLAGVG